jgi:D-galactose 1-dehydrogenase
VNPIAVAVIGFGKIAEDQHIPAIRQDPRFILAAVVESRRPGPLGVPQFASLDGLASSGLSVDAVAICTRPVDRFRAAADAIAYGYHVMLEKPPAIGISQANALRSLAEKSALTLYAAWHARENSAVDQARDWLQGQTINRFEINWLEDVQKWHPGQNWIWQPGGFGVFDPGINALSILTSILPEAVWPTHVRLHSQTGMSMPIRADISFDTLHSPDCGRACFDWSPINKEKWEITISTPAGHAEISSGGRQLRINGSPVRVPSKLEYQRVYGHFATLIEGRNSDVDLRPLELVADCFAIGELCELAHIAATNISERMQAK